MKAAEANQVSARAENVRGDSGQEGSEYKYQHGRRGFTREDDQKDDRTVRQDVEEVSTFQFQAIW